MRGTAERVAFILHDVFRYSFAEVGQIVGRTPAACRQLASSGRRRVRAAQAQPAQAPRQARLVSDFKRAWEAKDINALIGLLDPCATVTADGGGLVSAHLRPIEGAEQIAPYLVGLAGRASGNLTFLERTVNGQPGLVAQQGGVTVNGVRVRRPSGPDHPHLGRTKPRQAPALDDRLRRLARRSGDPGAGQGGSPARSRCGIGWNPPFLHRPVLGHGFVGPSR
jgi:hypothetical protein